MSGDSRMDLALRCAKAVIEMHFLEHGYGSPDDATVLAVRLIGHLDNEGRVK